MSNIFFDMLTFMSCWSSFSNTTRLFSLYRRCPFTAEKFLHAFLKFGFSPLLYKISSRYALYLTWFSAFCFSAFLHPIFSRDDLQKIQTKFLFWHSKFERSNCIIMASLFGNTFLQGKYHFPLFFHGSVFFSWREKQISEEIMTGRFIINCYTCNRH